MRDIRVGVAEDDPAACQTILDYLNRYQREESERFIVSAFGDGSELVSSYTPIYDILLLDIEMPGMNGIYVGNELKKANRNVIVFVVTSYSEYLDEAMRFHVFRYLSKPLDKQRFFRNLKDALAYYNSITLKIPVETKQAVYSFPASQIIAIEAQGRKVIVHTARQDFDSIHNMNYWLEKLPQNSFFQTHRSFIVNFEHIVDFDHSTVHLSNPQITAYLTRRKYSSFRNAYLLYLESMR